MSTYSVPAMPVPICIWRSSSWAATIPPANPPDVIDICNLVPGRRVWAVHGGLVAHVLVLSTCDIRFSESGAWGPGPPTDGDLVEVPQGSGRYYLVVDVEQLGLGFPNWHQEAALVKQSPFSVGPIFPDGSLLLETGTSYLLEDGTILLLE